MEFRNPETYLEGTVLFMDKPLTWTSFDVVNKIRMSLRHHLGIKKIKVGHAGTLDPLATGLVIICTGKSTKKIMQFQELDKTYEAIIRLGATTPSFDLETEIDRNYPYTHIIREEVEKALKGFRGPQMQMPPLYSAKSVDGKRAYEVARQGETLELKENAIQIHSLELTEFNLPDLSLNIRCSKGTYIRSLARDLGSALGSGGHLTGLRRTRIGSHSVSEAISPEVFENRIKLS